jgi:hypothetical protein
MSNQTFVGALLATTVALSALVGCQTPATPAGAGGTQTQNPAATGQVGQKGTPVAAPAAAGPATGKQAAGAQNGAELAAAMSEEREAEDYNAVASEDASRYEVFVVGQPKPEEGMVAITATGGAEAGAGNGGKGRAAVKVAKDARAAAIEKGMLKGKLRAELKEKLQARATKLKAKFKARAEKRKDAVAKIKDQLGKVDWVDNGDGTKTKAIEFDVAATVGGKAVTKHRKMERVVNEDGTLVSMSVEFSHTAPNGAAHTMTRTKTLQEDGSYKVVFHSEIKLGNGATRVCDWEKTISVDGAVTGTGKIEWKNASGTVTKSVAVKLGGTEEEETATTTDDGATTEVTAPVDGEIEAEVTADGTTTEVAIEEAADGTVESTTEVTAEVGTATPAPEASASPAPEASASPAA